MLRSIRPLGKKAEGGLPALLIVRLAPNHKSLAGNMDAGEEKGEECEEVCWTGIESELVGDEDAEDIVPDKMEEVVG